MRSQTVSGMLLLILAAALITGTLAWASKADRSVIKRGVLTEDWYAAGELVDVDAKADGDVVVAGRTIIVDGTVAGDVMAAGETVSIRAAVGDDIRAAGRTVTISADVGDDAIAAGEHVTLVPDVHVEGRAWFAGRTVEVAGRVMQELRASGRTLRVSGLIHGDAYLTGRHIEILPGAVIHGNLAYSSRNAIVIHDGASITGQLVEKPLPRFAQLAAEKRHRAIAAFVFLLSVVLAAIVFHLYLPNFTVVAARTIQTDPLKSVIFGFVVLTVSPFVIGLLAATVVGYLLAIIFALLYVLLLLAGLFTGIIWLGDLLLRIFRRLPDVSPSGRSLSIISAMIVLVLVQFIPYAGPWIVLTLFVLGVGSLKLAGYRVYRAESRALRKLEVRA